MSDQLTGADIEPLIKLAASIAKNDGHVQFSALIGAVVILARVQRIPRNILHRAIDASWSFDGSKPHPPINLFDQG